MCRGCVQGRSRAKRGGSNETALHSWNCETLPPRWIRSRRNLFMQIIRSDDKVGEGVSPVFSFRVLPSSICISNGTGRGHILRLVRLSCLLHPRKRDVPSYFDVTDKLKLKKKGRKRGRGKRRKGKRNINKEGRVGKGYSGNLYVRRERSGERRRFSLEFLPSGFIREENVHTRAGFGVGQQMKHVDIKATRFSVSETDRFTLAVNHITPWNIFSRLELNLGRALDASPRPSIHRRSRSPPLTHRLTVENLCERWISSFTMKIGGVVASCSCRVYTTWWIVGTIDFSLLIFFVTSIQSWNTSCSVYSPTNFTIIFIRSFDQIWAKIYTQAARIRAYKNINLLISKYIYHLFFFFLHLISNTRGKRYITSRRSNWPPLANIFVARFHRDRF